ncbi:MAG: outer membrane lipoprotein carrier protein LolA [Prevotellaceae bacterium]|jgi:outer membrane lipoprotein-sorting protein|nr:outer membrane lipoprotein carrier protein LolA [Prevotellaceae bacterium]
MSKNLTTTILFLMFCVNIFAQNGKKLSESEKAIFEQKMVEQSKKIETLQCNFVQEKTSVLVAQKAVSKGIMLYALPSKLRWEYTEPTPSTLILNGQNAALLDKNGQKIGNDKAIKPLGNIIISMINGDGIKNNRQFSTEIYETDKHFLIILTPIQKRLKEFYKNIELKIDKHTFLASEITMNEKSGDKMVISLINKKLNEKIDVSKFVIK